MITDRLRKWDDLLNPVLVKEVRQAMRGRFFAGVLVVLNVILMTAMLIAMAAAASKDAPGGVGLFLAIAYSVMLGFCCLALIPGYVGGRFIESDTGEAMEILYSSAIKPRQIIIGKLLGGLVVAGLVYSVFLPYLVVCPLFRGVDVLSVLVMSLSALLIAPPMLSFGVLQGALVWRNVKRKNKPLAANQKKGAAVGLFILFGYMGFSLLFGAGRMLFRSGGFGSSVSWMFFVWAVPLSLSITAVAVCAAIGVVSPPPFSRMTPLRVCLTALWLVGGLVALIYGLTTGGWRSGAGAWIPISFIAAGFFAVLSCGERLEYGFHVRRRVPRRWLWRKLSLPFFTGAANSFLWSFILGGASIAAVWILCLFTDAGHEPEQLKPFGAAPLFTSGFLICAAYGLLWFKIRTGFIGRRWPKPPYALLAFVTMALMTAAALAVHSIIKDGPSDLRMALKPVAGIAQALVNISPIGGFVDHQVAAFQLVFAVLFFLIMFIWSVPSLMRIMNGLRPPEDAGE